MNREIKFRRAHYWKEAFLKFTYWGFIDDSFISPSRISCSDSHTDEQFTGLNDKNGKEIYEGDTVRCLVGHKNRKKDLYTIVYRLGSPSMDNGTTETPVSFPTLQDQLWTYLDYDTKISLCLEITGNIHENENTNN